MMEEREYFWQNLLLISVVLLIANIVKRYRFAEYANHDKKRMRKTAKPVRIDGKLNY